MTATPTSSPGSGIESHILSVGGELYDALGAVLETIPGSPHRPQALAQRLGLDKVLTSRLLKSLRQRDPMSVVHAAPGPDPLRRVIKSANRHGVPADLIARAERAIDDFEVLIRHDAGDRSGLDAIISTWLPDARREFELRRKQAAFKAMSQLRGACAEVDLATVLLHPSPDNDAKVDVVWVFGLLGLRRLRPRCPVKFSSRKMQNGEPRHPMTLDGTPVSSLEGLRLDDFCSSPPPTLEVQTVGASVHYSLGEHGFGPQSAVDLVFAEANFAEIDRHPEEGRKRHVFAEASTPTKLLQFDVFVHQDLYASSEPELAIYDTSFEGIASINDPAREIDRYDLAESISLLGRGTTHVRTGHVPRYADLLGGLCQRLDWTMEDFRGYRCEIEYPIYGSQIVMAFTA